MINSITNLSSSGTGNQNHQKSFNNNLNHQTPTRNQNKQNLNPISNPNPNSNRSYRSNNLNNTNNYNNENISNLKTNHHLKETETRRGFLGAKIGSSKDFTWAEVTVFLSEDERLRSSLAVGVERLLRHGARHGKQGRIGGRGRHGPRHEGRGKQAAPDCGSRVERGNSRRNCST